jgi:cardiolipin synthase
MLETGVRFFFYRKGFLHSKVLIVDDVLASVGSANMDFRSFEQNFEVTAFIYDEDISLQMKETFLTDLSDSHEILLDEWVKRPVWEKIKESFARLFSPLL